MDTSVGDIDSDPNWVDYLNPTQRKVLEDLKKQQQEFDVHYDEWQKELQTWRAANANHSDPKSYRDYARQWEDWKNKLLSQKDQMERLYKQTLIQLKTQAAKQKEQKMNMNQHRPIIPQQFAPPPNPQLNFQSRPPMYSQQPYFNQPIMNSPYYGQQRPYGAVPYQQPRYNRTPLNPIVTPPHLYSNPMPGIMMPPIVQAQANAPVPVYPALSQQSSAQPFPLADPKDSSKSATGTKAIGTSRVDDIVKRASQLIPGLGQYLDEDSSDETEFKKVTVDLTGDEEFTNSKGNEGTRNQSSIKSASSNRNNENNNSKQDLIGKNIDSNNVISSEKANKTTSDTRSMNKSSLEYASKERSNQRNVPSLKESVRSNLMSDSDSEDDIYIEHIPDDEQNKSFDLDSVMNQMKSIKPANNNNQTSHSLASDHDDRNPGQSLQRPQQTSDNQQPSPFQFRGRISTEGLKTVIEPVDDKPKQQTSPEAISRHDPNRRRPEGFHPMEGSNISRPRQPYVAKTFDYDHGSPSIGPSLPPPRGPDPLRPDLYRAPLRSAIPRGPPPRFGSRPYINNRGPPPQIPPFNRAPPNTPLQGPVFGPHPPNRPAFGGRPYFNERPRFGPSFAGPPPGIPRGPANPPRPVFNPLPQSSNSSFQQPYQRSEIPVKQLTHKDEEYFTAPPSGMVSLEELLVPPTRDFRPKSIVIILRGLPGSGKTHLAKSIRDKETENGGSAPRILSIDDYFMVEKEVMITDENGKKMKSKEFVYEYEEAMEVSYRSSLLKAFKKTTDAPYFKFIIVDAVNSCVSHFNEFHAHAVSKGFTVYICEIDSKDTEICTKRNVHNRTLEDVRKLARIWEKTPKDFIKLDTTTFMQNILTEEAENNKSDANAKEKRRLDETEEDDIISKKLASGVNPSRDEVESKAELSKSRWEKMEESSEIDHDRLDAFKVKRKITMDEYLQLPDDYDQRSGQPNKKRVRWADVEERKNQQKMRNLGFIVGQNWEQVLDPSNPEKALNRTKYI